MRHDVIHDRSRLDSSRPLAHHAERVHRKKNLARFPPALAIAAGMGRPPAVLVLPPALSLRRRMRRPAHGRTFQRNILDWAQA